MADVKISQLPAATTPLDGTEVLPIVQSATTKQVSIANVTAGRAMAASSLTLTTPLAVTSGGTGIATAAQGSLLSATAADTFSATRTPTLGLAGTAAGTLGLSGSTSGVVTLATAATAGTWTLTLPTSGGTNGYILTTNGSGTTQWSNPTALGIDLDVGTTAITGGTTGRVLYDNGGFLGEYTAVPVGFGGTGTSTTFTAGSVVFAGASGVYGQDNANLFWDDSNNRLGVGTSSPSFKLQVSGDGANTLPTSSGQIVITGATNPSQQMMLGYDTTNNYGYIQPTLVGTAYQNLLLCPGGGNVTLNSATFSPTSPSTAGNLALTGTVAMGSSFKRNRLINGNMQVWQRGTSGFASAALVYSADRWFTVNAASAVAQSSDVPTGFQYSLNYASSTATFPYVAQRIEDINVRDLAGKTVTFSFWAKNVSGTSVLYLEAYYPTAVNNYSSVTNIFSYVLATSPSSSWTYYTYSATLPSQVSNGMEIRIIRNNVSAASTLVTGVQVEEGSIATPYERQIYSDQLAQCQRYYWRLYGGSSNQRYGAGYALTTTSANIIMPFPVIMRTAPGALEQSGTASDYLVVYQAAATVCNAVPTIGSCTTAAALTNFSTGVLLTAGDGIMATSNSANSYLGWSAEL